MIDQFYLAMLSLGASTAALILALYLIAKTRQVTLGVKGLPSTAENLPVITLPVRNIGLELKRLVDKE